MSREAMKLALEALESYKDFIDDANIIEGQWLWIDGADNAQTALREALAQQEQEQVAWMTQAKNFVHLLKVTEAQAKLYGWKAVYTNPPQPAQRTWVGLTDEERNDCLVSADPCEALAEPEARQLMEDVEAKLKEKNNG